MSPKPKFWVKETHSTKRWGPRVGLSFIETVLCDGGCPKHPRPMGTPVERLLAIVFDSCGCIAYLLLTVDWYWGNQSWGAVLAEWKPVWHPRYRAPFGRPSPGERPE